jgi:hypothetical protein
MDVKLDAPDDAKAAALELIELLKAVVHAKVNK